MENYNYNNLSEMIGETVQLSDEQGNTIELKVTEVNKGSMDGDEYESFTVIYSRDENCNIQEGTYTLTHQCFGDATLFLSPNSATECETVINRKKS